MLKEFRRRELISGVGDHGEFRVEEGVGRIKPWLGSSVGEER